MIAEVDTPNMHSPKKIVFGLSSKFSKGEVPIMKKLKIRKTHAQKITPFLLIRCSKCGIKSEPRMYETQGSEKYRPIQNVSMPYPFR